MELISLLIHFLLLSAKGNISIVFGLLISEVK